MASHRLTPRFSDLPTEDFPITIETQLLVNEVDTRADRQAFVEAFGDTKDLGGYFEARLLPAAVAHLRDRSAAQLLDDPAGLAEALREAAKRIAFAAGLEIERLDIVRLVSPARERHERLERDRAEMAERLRQADDALGRFNDLRDAGDRADVALGKVLADLPADRRDDVWLAALRATAEPTSTLYAVSGDTLTRIDCGETVTVHEPQELPTKLGPARSVSTLGDDLAIGCRGGVWLVRGGDVADRTALPFDTHSDRGFKSVVRDAGAVIAFHSLVGTVRWAPGEPGEVVDTKTEPEAGVAVPWLDTALPVEPISTGVRLALPDASLTLDLTNATTSGDLAASAGHIAAVTADRRSVVVWRLGDKEPMESVPLMVQTKHRIGDVTFGIK